MTDTMKLWDSVSKSDPRYLRRVSIGARSFTSIDPQYQVMSATKAFGPVGDGWGWNAETKFINLSNGDTAVVSEVRVWHGTQGNSFGPFPGCRKFFDAAKGRMNEDAPKMSVTDGLTKALSHLGFNADVFLGEHDGDKYSADSTKSGKPSDAGGW